MPQLKPNRYRQWRIDEEASVEKYGSGVSMRPEVKAKATLSAQMEYGNTQGIRDLHRLTNLMEVFREVDTELSLQSVQIFMLTALAEIKAGTFQPESEGWYDTFMTVFEVAEILNMTPASASRNVASLSDKPRGKGEPLRLIDKDTEHKNRKPARLLRLTRKGYELLSKIEDVLGEDFKAYDLKIFGSEAGDKRKGWVTQENRKADSDRAKYERERREKAALQEQAKVKDEKLAALEARLEALEAKGSVGQVSIETTLEETARVTKALIKKSKERDEERKISAEMETKVTHPTPSPKGYLQFTTFDAPRRGGKENPLTGVGRVANAKKAVEKPSKPKTRSKSA